MWCCWTRPTYISIGFAPVRAQNNWPISSAECLANQHDACKQLDVRLPSPRDFRWTVVSVYQVRAISAATAVFVCRVGANFAELQCPSTESARFLTCCLVGIGEDRQTVDSRERRRPTPFVHVLGGKYPLYIAGSYTTPNGRETLTQSLNRKGWVVKNFTKTRNDWSQRMSIGMSVLMNS